MELHQLRYAVRVAQSLNFSKAAADLFVTQPNLSHQILKLENELGVTLFERKTRSVKLTLAGERFVGGAKRVLAELDELNHAMQEYGALGTGEIKIGTLPFSGNQGLTSFIPAFQKKYPGIQIKIMETAGGQDLLKQLIAGTVDVVCAFFDIDRDYDVPVKLYPLSKGNVVLITSSAHRFAQEPKIFLSDAADELFILPPLTHNMRELALHTCRASGFEPKIACECNQHNTLFNLVANGFGISFISSQFIDNALSANTKVIPFDPLIDRTLCLAVMENKHQSPAISVFRDFILKATSVDEKSA